jgi:hypothetical protein
MKVPTYHKYGLTKAGVDKSELRDRKISDILTHHLTIGIGIVLGILIYILNYSKVQPSNFIQAVMQVFLFASVGVICVGIPAVLFKFAEIFYFKYIRSKSKEKQNIEKYREEREEFDFWKIRKDYSFWRVLDGLSFEKEIINIFLHMGGVIKDELYTDEYPNDRVIEIEGGNVYISFNTGNEITETGYIQNIINLKEKKSCVSAKIFSQRGFSRKVWESGNENGIGLYDINGLIKMVREIKTIK